MRFLKRQLRQRRSLCLFIGYVVYIIIGALIFKKVEHQEENQKCEIAKNELIKETHRFGNEYIFDLGLNLKYCSGIPRVAAANRQAGYFDPELVEIFEEWYESGCTFAAFNHLTDELKLVGPRVAPQLSDFYKSIMAVGDMKPKFDEEVFTISGRTLRKILKQSAQFGIHHYQKLNEACETRWDFESAFFFSGTVATTIGYGNIAPSTNTGKVFTLVFSLIGIPYFGILTRVLSEDIKRAVNSIKDQIRRRFHICPKYIAQWIYIGCGVVSLILIPSFIFNYIESWTIFDSIYFSLISLSTIGLGDLTPRTTPPLWSALNVMNDTACLAELINPVPSGGFNPQNVEASKCAPNTWAERVNNVFHIYRMLIFFWILFGLLWLGGIISLALDYFRNRRRLANLETVETVQAALKKLNEIPWSRRSRCESIRGQLRISRKVPNRCPKQRRAYSDGALALPTCH